MDFLQKIKPYSVDSIALSPSINVIENKPISATTKAEVAKFNLLMKHASSVSADAIDNKLAVSLFLNRLNSRDDNNTAANTWNKELRELSQTGAKLKFAVAARPLDHDELAIKAFEGRYKQEIKKEIERQTSLMNKKVHLNNKNTFQENVFSTIPVSEIETKVMSLINHAINKNANHFSSTDNETQTNQNLVSVCVQQALNEYYG